jgi:hypothetical protein
MQMTLDELLNHDEASIDDMEKYFASVGLRNVKKKDLDQIIERFGPVVFKLYCFSEVYKIVLENETSRNMHRWTYIIGVMTVLYTFLTFLMLFR